MGGSLVSFVSGFASGAVAVGVTVPFIYQLVRDRKTTAREQAELETKLVSELASIVQCSQDLWAGLGPTRYGDVLMYYHRGGLTHKRVDIVLDYWSKVGCSYADKHVNRKRFLPRIAPACNGAWEDLDKVIEYFDISQPSRIADFKRLQKDVARYIGKNRKRLNRMATRSSGTSSANPS